MKRLTMRKIKEAMRLYANGLSMRKIASIPDHMPASHRRHSELSPERLKAWAAKIGPNTATLIEVILRDRIRCEGRATPPKTLTRAKEPDIKNHAYAATILR